MTKLSLSLAVLGLSLAACQSSEEPAVTASNPAPSAAQSASPLTPLPGKEGSAPALTDVTKVRLETTAGEVVIEVYPQAAPNAAKRFVELVTSGFYDDTPVSRVVPGFVAQFGINWREPHKAYEDRPFNDDPSLFALERGTLAFAKAGRPGTASTQVFINYRDNSRLADPSPQLSFWTFGKVVSGMDVVDSFVQAGDPSDGLDQARLWADGGAYLESLAVKPTMIESASVVQ
jgi:peptidyl-prolyl cis-trans isomerase A (cyclophilin A)